MNINKTTFAILIIAIVVFCKLRFYDNIFGVKSDSICENHFGSDNRSVFIAGSRTFHGPVPPKVIYATIKKNFLALTCALEVFPRYAVKAIRKSDLYRMEKK